MCSVSLSIMEVVYAVAEKDCCWDLFANFVKSVNIIIVVKKERW